MTLGVLLAYRHEKIGTKLLNSVLLECEKDETVDHIYLHVQVGNEEAIAFYHSFGFETTDTIKDYYQNISPPDCFILKKTFQRS